MEGDTNINSMSDAINMTSSDQQHETITNESFDSESSEVDLQLTQTQQTILASQDLNLNISQSQGGSLRIEEASVLLDNLMDTGSDGPDIVASGNPGGNINDIPIISNLSAEGLTALMNSSGNQNQNLNESNQVSQIVTDINSRVSKCRRGDSTSDQAIHI